MTLDELLKQLSAAATPGPWNPDPKRLTLPLSDGTVAQGPLMSYLVGNRSSQEGMMVSLGSERVADRRFVAALVNAYRNGKLVIRPEEVSNANLDRARRRLHGIAAAVAIELDGGGKVDMRSLLFMLKELRDWLGPLSRPQHGDSK